MIKYIILILFPLLFLCCSEKSTPSRDFNWDSNYFEQNGFTLKWESNDSSFDVQTKQKLIKTFFLVYPKLVKDFNPVATKTVSFKVDTAYKAVAAASRDKVVFAPEWFRANPNDIDVVTHEVMHIVQGYPNYNPWWLVEGIADYVRYKYGVANAVGGWSLPDVNAAQKYDNGYRVTARFLAWCEKKKTGSVKIFDNSLRKNTYSKELWISIFEKSIDELWSEYLANPVI